MLNQQMNPYEVLEIERNADDNTIKKAYYKLAKKYHPDRNKGDPIKQEKFKEVNIAYSILTNKGSSGSSGSDFNPNFDFSNINLPNLFSSVKDKFLSEAKLFTKFFNEKKTQNKDDNLDILVNLKVDLNDIYFGTIRKVKIPIKKKCRYCMSLGLKVYEEGKIDTCNECNGLKYIEKNEEFVIDTSEKKVSFFRKGHESLSSPTGDVHFIIHPKFNNELIGINENAEIMVMNNYDILILVSLKKIYNNNLEKERLSLFNDTIKLDFDSKKNRHIFKNMGLIVDTITNRGDIHVLLIE